MAAVIRGAKDFFQQKILDLGHAYHRALTVSRRPLVLILTDSDTQTVASSSYSAARSAARSAS